MPWPLCYSTYASHMFIGCSAHTDQSNVKASKTYHWDEHQHTNKQENKPVLITWVKENVLATAVVHDYMYMYVNVLCHVHVHVCVYTHQLGSS